MNPFIQLRGACYLLVLVGVSAIPFALAQRNAPSQRLAKPATTIVVTNTNDSGPGSLRDALASANDGDTIDATGVSGTILLTSGELQINHNLTITGPGAANLAINGNATFRVFENFASNVTISGLTITNGFTTDGIYGGGGILNHAGLTFSSSSIVSNVGGAYGGGISSSGGEALTVTNSLISGNSSGINGGGIAFSGGGTLTMTNSVISGNNSGAGGGIHADGVIVTVSNSTINGNVAGCNDGGGIAITDNARLTVTNTTISNNVANDNFGGCFDQAAYGGGIAIEGGGALTVTNSTISGNIVAAAMGDGGGVYGGMGTLTVTNSTISDSSAPGSGGSIWNGALANIGDTILSAGASGGTIFNSGAITSLGYNLASDNGGGVLTGPGDQINTNPMLGPLQNNGGPTFTHALLPDSPAINAGNPSFTPPPRYDQRGPGFRRVVHGRIDIGSFEVQRR